MRLLSLSRLLSLRLWCKGGGSGLFLLFSLLGYSSLLHSAEPEWTLRGTLVTQAPGGYAIIENGRTHEQRWVRKDALLPGEQGRLIAVYVDHALVRDAGGERRLDFGMRLEPSNADIVSESYRISRTEIPRWIQHLDLIPHQQGGRVVGYFANRIPGELRGRIGLQPGDLLRAVNGVALSGDLDPKQLYQEVSKPMVTVDVTRRGEPMQLVYRLD